LKVKVEVSRSSSQDARVAMSMAMDSCPMVLLSLSSARLISVMSWVTPKPMDLFPFSSLTEVALTMM